MAFQCLINELEQLQSRFSSWKQTYPHRHFPKVYWDEALNLIDKYSLKEVAEAIGCTSTYLAHKQRIQLLKSPQIEFAEIQPRASTSQPHQVTLHIQSPTGNSLKLSFNGHVEQVFPLISSLFKEEMPCSR